MRSLFNIALGLGTSLRIARMQGRCELELEMILAVQKFLLALPKCGPLYGALL